MSYHYQSAILGGTFDHFHLGHERFISEALNRTQHLTLGIVQQSISPDKSFLGSIENYATRAHNLRTFLTQLGAAPRTSVIPINDIYGTTLVDSELAAIFVTAATRANATEINHARHDLRLPPLEIIEIPYALGDDHHIISSSRIRKGEIDRQGKSYLQYFLQKNIYHLPDQLRANLQKPIGSVITDLGDITKIIPPHSLVVSVGDIVTLDLYKANYPVAISIIDYRTRRHDLSQLEIKKYFPITNYQIKNHAGTINSQIAEAFLASLATHENDQVSSIIAVTGEEDLLTLPAILLSPLDSYVIYGQHQVGMCIVRVTEELKVQIRALLGQFD